MAKTGKVKDRLRAQRVFHVPLREVSGICLRRGRNSQMSLIAIGDRVATLVWTSVPHEEEGLPVWHTIDIAGLPGSGLPAHDPQIEAVCADGAARVLLLQEAPPRAELVDLGRSRVVASINLTVEGRSEVARSWSDPKGSRGEGVVFLPGGHLLVAKEKDPTALIEFGPRGARSRGLQRGGALAGGARWSGADGNQEFVARAVWLPDNTLRKTCADFSDLEIGPDGRLYLLSDQSATIARIDELVPGGGVAALTASWRLDDVGGKPEGLAFTQDGRAIVALDKRKKRQNLVLLEPAIASSPGRQSQRVQIRSAVVPR
jgi:SdiA-regulated